ncbi:unnamed protein product [Amoebophrya sp. A120]|nr:unnamed protein product [Amoebophrya sp. A120]|eukprot:GSA120T00012213001.1
MLQRAPSSPKPGAVSSLSAGERHLFTLAALCLILFIVLFSLFRLSSIFIPFLVAFFLAQLLEPVALYLATPRGWLAKWIWKREYDERVAAKEFLALRDAVEERRRSSTTHDADSDGLGSCAQGTRRTSEPPGPRHAAQDRARKNGDHCSLAIIEDAEGGCDLGKVNTRDGGVANPGNTTRRTSSSTSSSSTSRRSRRSLRGSGEIARREAASAHDEEDAARNSDVEKVEYDRVVPDVLADTQDHLQEVNLELHAGRKEQSRRGRASARPRRASNTTNLTYQDLDPERCWVCREVGRKTFLVFTDALILIFCLGLLFGCVIFLVMGLTNALHDAPAVFQEYLKGEKLKSLIDFLDKHGIHNITPETIIQKIEGPLENIIGGLLSFLTTSILAIMMLCFFLVASLSEAHPPLAASYVQLVSLKRKLCEEWNYRTSSSSGGGGDGSYSSSGGAATRTNRGAGGFGVAGAASGFIPLELRRGPGSTPLFDLYNMAGRSDCSTTSLPPLARGSSLSSGRKSAPPVLAAADENLQELQFMAEQQKQGSNCPRKSNFVSGTGATAYSQHELQSGTASAGGVFAQDYFEKTTISTDDDSSTVAPSTLVEQQGELLDHQLQVITLEEVAGGAVAGPPCYAPAEQLGCTAAGGNCNATKDPAATTLQMHSKNRDPPGATTTNSKQTTAPANKSSASSSEEAAKVFAGQFLKQARHTIQLFVVLKTFLSVLEGVLVGMLLAAVKVDFWFVFSVITFLMNYIPAIGGAISLIGPGVFCFLDPKKTFADLVLITAGGGVLHTFVGNIIEPSIFGNAFELDPIVVLFALVVWGALWGVVGAILSVPLTCCIKLALAPFIDRHAYALVCFYALEFSLPPPAAWKRLEDRQRRAEMAIGSCKV